MENRNQPAFPFVAGDQSNVDDRVVCEGLSKRELIAAMAMQGLLANPNWMKYYKDDSYLMKSAVAAEVSIQYTDELLKQLSPL